MSWTKGKMLSIQCVLLLKNRRVLSAHIHLTNGPILFAIFSLQLGSNSTAFERPLIHVDGNTTKSPPTVDIRAPLVKNGNTAVLSLSPLSTYRANSLWWSGWIYVPFEVKVMSWLRSLLSTEALPTLLCCSFLALRCFPLFFLDDDTIMWFYSSVLQCIRK